MPIADTTSPIATPVMPARFDSAYFEAHDRLLAESAGLEGVEVALQDARQRLARDSAHLVELNGDVASTRRHIQHHQQKIISCERGWRKHALLQPDTWLSGGVQPRLVRQTEKLKAREAEEARLRTMESEKKKQTRAAQDTVRQLEGAERRKRAVDAEAGGMYSQCVDALQSPALASLRGQRALWQQAVDLESANAAELEKAAKLCARAHQEYAQAAQALAAAGRTNQNAQFANTMDLFTPGESFGLELFESVGQVQRDQMMHAARRHVGAGGRCLQEAMQRLPAAALQRYPGLSGGLGEVHLPRVELTGGGELMLEVFGGDFGDMIANSSASGKIARSLQAIDECLRIVAQQHDLMRHLLLALRADGAKAAAGLRQTDAAAANESDRIWREARACAAQHHGSSAALDTTSRAAAALPVAVAVPVSEPPVVVTGVPVA